MEDFYNKNDVVELAQRVFLSNLVTPHMRKLPTDILTITSINTAESFFNTAEGYHRGEFGRAGKSDELEKERRQTEDRRKGDRRTEAKGCTCSEQEDEAFARMEKALREHFQTAVDRITKG